MKALLVALLAACSLHVWGQTRFEYLYDNAGNRIKRQIVVLSKAPQLKSGVVQPQEPQPTVESIGRQKVKIYPNPTDGYIRVELEGFDDSKISRFTVQLFTSYGKQLMENVMGASLFEVDMSRYQTGAYILNLLFTDQRLSFKIIKN